MHNPNTFKINFINNIDEVYGAVTDLLTGLKNNTDVMVDIEMSKVEAEQRKASAFEALANNSINNKNQETKSNSYVQELKDLKELLDSGIITKEEFETKKKKLLDK